MCIGGSAPSAPKATPKPVQTKDLTEAATTARDKQKDKAKKSFGQQGTILTGGLGLGNTATAKPLLGA